MRDAGAGVADPHLDFTPPSQRGPQTSRHGQAPATRHGFDGILDQVPQRLPHQHFIDADPRHVRKAGHFDMGMGGRHLFQHLLDHPLEPRPHVDRLEVGVGLPRKIEELRDQMVHV